MRAWPVVLLLSCAHLAPPAGAPPVDLTGDWTPVAEDAPPGPRTIGGCWAGYGSVRFTPVDGRWTTEGHRVGYGVAPPPWTAELTGEWRDGRIVLEGREDPQGPPPGDAVTWSLTYDTGRGHLVGTRTYAGGRPTPLRLARLSFAAPPPFGCGPPPP